MATPNESKNGNGNGDGYKIACQTTINNLLDNLKAGKGSTLLIPIEAGADKSIINYLKEKAKELGYDFKPASFAKPDYFGEQVLSAHIKDLQIEHPPKLLQVVLQYKSGKMGLANYPQTDQEIFSSMIGATDSFLVDSFQQDGAIVEDDADSAINKGDYSIISRNKAGKYINAVAKITGDATEELETDLDSMLQKAEEKYQSILPEWGKTGIVDNVAGMTDIIKTELFDSKKYSGEFDADRLTHEHESRAVKTWKILEEHANKNPVILFLENLEQLNEADASALLYMIRSTPDSKILIAGAYDVDPFKEKSENSYLNNIEDALKDENYVQKLILHSPKNFEEELQKHFKDISPYTLTILAFAAAAGNASDKRIIAEAAKFRGVKEYTEIKKILDITNGNISGLLENFKPANSKIARKAMEQATPELYKAVAQAIEEAKKGKLKYFSPLIAELYQKAEDKEKAIGWAGIAAEHAQQNKNTDQAIYFHRIIFEQGSAENKLNSLERIVKIGWEGGKDRQQVLADAEELEKLALKTGARDKLYTAMLYGARVYAELKKTDEALKSIEQTDELSKKLGEEENFDIEQVKGVVFLAKKEYENALAEFEKAFSIAVKKENEKEQFKALVGKANAFKNLKRYDEAKQIYEKQEILTKMWKDHHNTAIVLNNLAAAYWFLEKYNDADKCVNEGLDICEANDIVDCLPNLNNTKCAIAIKKNKLHEAIEMIPKTLRQSEIAGNDNELLQSIDNLRGICDAWEEKMRRKNKKN